MPTMLADTPRCSVYIATSLDGFIARPDGGLDWLARVESPGNDYGYADFMASVDALVMGRGTYEVALGFPEWPYAAKRCIVCTKRDLASQHGETFHGGTPTELVAQLAREGVRHVYVDGGSLIRAFVRAGLIHDLTIAVVPVLLGAGIPLWSDGGPEVALRVESSRCWPSGLVQTRYAVA